MNKRILILGLIVIAVVAGFIGLAGYLKMVSTVPTAVNPNLTGEKVFAREYSHMTGKIGAKVTLVEFGDYQCPFCADAAVSVEQVVAKYKNNPDFNFIYRNFPLPQHPNAKESAETAEAAGAQGKYFEMYDLLYQKQDEWSGNINPMSNFVSYAQELHLDIIKFKEEVRTSKYINQITQDKLDGEALGINSTPTFFLNGRRLEGFGSLDQQVGDALK